MVNRVGDMGLSIAIMLMFTTFGSASPSPTCCPGRRRPPSASTPRMTGDRLHAAAGRVRQVGAGAAAVLARRRDGGPDPGLGPHPRGHHGDRGRVPGHPVRRRSSTRRPTRRLAVVVVGTVTLLFGAIVGCAKDDIKKALAGSTMSQIGYMMHGGRARPDRLRLRDHAPGHARLLQGRALPRRRFRHARHERRGRHAPATAACASTCRSPSSPSASATWRSSASPVCPASGPRTRSSRRRSPRAAPRAGSSARSALLGAGDHRVLHDARDADDVLRREALGSRTPKGHEPHPHESPAVHDRSR